MQCVVDGILEVAVGGSDGVEKVFCAGDEMGGWIELVKVVVFGMFQKCVARSLNCTFHGCSMGSEDGILLLEGNGLVNEVFFGAEGRCGYV